ncbi:MAG: segregation/condensation protein A [Armatimonadetes bacterium]|nr:segregation/condensation protein A [Armatimonadota bacterium]
MTFPAATASTFASPPAFGDLSAPILLPPSLPQFLPELHVGTFEGPLDLLLHLVRQGRMDIFDLPIATLCDQYLAYLNAMESLDLSVAGDFLVMAATLLETKSRLLLPAPPKAEPAQPGDAAPEDPRAVLVRQLLDYSRYQSLSESLRVAENETRQLFFRDRVALSGEYRTPPRFGELSAEALLRALEKMFADVGAGEKQITSVRRQKITLRMKMREILYASKNAGETGVTLETLLPAAPFALLDVVLLFLALLELLKNGSVTAFQDEFCGTIRVVAVEREAGETDG